MAEKKLPADVLSSGNGAPASNQAPKVGLGKDYTIFATVDGEVKFEWAAKGRRRVSVTRWKPPS
ncbi:MAG: hypothetical protein Ct9H300mP11_06220 [Chloroflexota bacterium]|nr:MAG: hypothetical protein Ct9H300mP11_06220 [Chloroflexota bacterium]